MNNEQSIYDYLYQYDQSSLIVYEPTGIYGKIMEKVCNNLGLCAYYVHPNDMQSMMSIVWSKNKTDKCDAYHIAHIWCLLHQQSIQGNNNKLIKANSNTMNQICAYLTQIHFMKQQIKKLKQGIEVEHSNAYHTHSHILYQSLIDQIKAWIQEFENKIIEEFETMWMKQHFDTLQSIPCVGKVVALELVCFFGQLQAKGLKKEDTKKVVAYAWLNPVQKESWSSIRWSYLSRKWNSHVRCALYMTWVQRIKQSKVEKYAHTNIALFTQRISQKFSSPWSKRWKSIACAVSRKILCIAWSMFHTWYWYNFA